MKLTMRRVVVVLPKCTKFWGKIVFTLPLVSDEDYFPQKLRASIKDNKNSPHGKFHGFLFPLSSKFRPICFPAIFTVTEVTRSPVPNLY